MTHIHDCIRCKKRKTRSNLRKISGWIAEFFVAAGYDLKKSPFICPGCRYCLEKLKKNGGIFSEHTKCNA